MDSRGQIYKEISERFDFLCTSNEKVNVLACAQRLVSNYPEDLNSELADELIQFHRYVMHKNGNNFKFFNQANLYKIMWEDKITSAFPNVDTALRLFLSLMVTNCSAERSFSQLKRLKSPCRTMITQERLDALSLLCIESDLLHEIDFDELIKDFAAKKTRKQYFKN